MKLSAQVLSAILLVSAAKADLMFDALEDIDCKGVDFATCSPGELNFLAEQVEATFNTRYSPDRYLADTHWIGMDMDAAEGNGRRLRTSGGHIGGNSGCQFCPTDDAFVKEGGDELEGRAAWARDLTVALAESGFSCFQGAKNCVVDLTETPKGKKVSSLITKESSEAAMRVQCQHVDWTGLTSAEKKFAAAKLQRAFNSVSDGTKTLQDIQWESGAEQSASLMEYLVGLSWSQGSLGYFRGVLLGNSAINMKILRANNDADLVDRWADMFESLLADGPFSSLAHANQCQVQIDAVPSAAATDA